VYLIPQRDGGKSSANLKVGDRKILDYRGWHNRFESGPQGLCGYMMTAGRGELLWRVGQKEIKNLALREKERGGVNWCCAIILPKRNQ
jgi:hypothetical protein